jgi:diacylglycerol kinase (CTP)
MQQADKTPPDLQALVSRTEGPQPWRRVFHAANGLVLAAILFRVPSSRSLVTLVLGGILLCLVLLDLVRLGFPLVNRIFFRAFLLLASPREARRPASSTWYVLGVLLALLLFPLEASVPGILVLALADPAASVVGRRLGRRPMGKGTWEGSAVFFVVAFGTLALFTSWPVALATALATSAVETLPWPVDDNLSVPLVSAGVLYLLT